MERWTLPCYLISNIMSFNYQEPPTRNILIDRYVARSYAKSISRSVLFVSEYWYRKYARQVSRLSQIFRLLQTYKDDDAWICHQHPPFCLYNLLSSGCRLPFVRSTFWYVDHWLPQLQKDLDLMLQLVPSSLDFCSGSMRCRSNVTPLYMACINEKVPVEVVHKVYIMTRARQRGPQVYNKSWDKIMLNNHTIHWTQDIRNNVSAARWTALQSIIRRES